MTFLFSKIKYFVFAIQIFYPRYPQFSNEYEKEQFYDELRDRGGDFGFLFWKFYKIQFLNLNFKTANRSSVNIL